MQFTGQFQETQCVGLKGRTIKDGAWRCPETEWMSDDGQRQVAKTYYIQFTSAWNVGRSRDLTPEACDRHGVRARHGAWIAWKRWGALRLRVCYRVTTWFGFPTRRRKAKTWLDLLLIATLCVQVLDIDWLP
jgi:hypothetical protein